MKLLIKLLIVALIANGTWRVGTAYMNYYKFKDAVRETVQFRGTKSDAQIHDRVFELASEYGIPVTDENLTITREEGHTIVDGSYIQPIDIVPTFKYNCPFKVHIDTFVVEGERPIR
jgi:hypothetical protein